MAGIQVSINGRIWVSPEGNRWTPKNQREANIARRRGRVEFDCFLVPGTSGDSGEPLVVVGDPELDERRPVVSYPMQ
jgi:hypothetical protein